jgi:hypothetical protein
MDSNPRFPESEAERKCRSRSLSQRHHHKYCQTFGRIHRRGELLRAIPNFGARPNRGDRRGVLVPRTEPGGAGHAERHRCSCRQSPMLGATGSHGCQSGGTVHPRFSPVGLAQYFFYPIRRKCPRCRGNDPTATAESLMGQSERCCVRQLRAGDPGPDRGAVVIPSAASSASIYRNNFSLGIACAIAQMARTARLKVGGFFS